MMIGQRKFHLKIKDDMQEIMNTFFLSNGMIHLGYKVSGEEDLINPYSVNGHEVLNDAFLDYIEQMLPFIPGNTPVILEISGCDLSEAEKIRIEQTLCNHFKIRMAQRQRACRQCLLKSLWFLISFIISSYLLFCTDDNTNNVIIQYAYLPFWFFGYRFITYLVLDYLPLLRERRKYAQLANMTVFFTQEAVDSLPVEATDTFADRIAEKLGIAKNENHKYNFEKAFLKSRVNYDQVIGDYFMDTGSTKLQCQVDSFSECIRDSSFIGYELPDEGFISYIENTIPCIPWQSPVTLVIQCKSLTAKEKDTITQAVRRHFFLGWMNADKEAQKNLWRIISFSACLLVSGLILFLAADTDKAFHEFLTMLFWFFGDYLIEFLLIGNREVQEARKLQEKMCNMEIVYTEKD